MGNTEVAEIEKAIKQSKQVVDFGAAVERLRTNKDFKKVVLESYFEQEPIRLVHLKADVAMQSPESQRSIVAQMDAIGAFNAFLGHALQQARIAAKQVAQGEEMLEQINAEEGDE